MSITDIIHAWKDEEYRLSLSQAERALLPEHPAGLIELTDPELDSAAGGLQRYTGTNTCTVANEICCCDSNWICGSKAVC